VSDWPKSGFLTAFLRNISQRVEPGAGGRRFYSHGQTELSFAWIDGRDALFSFLPIAA
jgi:hypothetical protein